MLTAIFSADNTVVALDGELTFSDYQVVRDAMAKLLETEAKRVFLDCQKLTFIDSAGLGMLLVAREDAGRNGRAIVLQHPHGQVMRMLEIAKFDTRFSIEI